MIALTIAGSDSGGGAGIQADLKTFAALGVYGASVITALTAQNTIGVQGVFPIPADFVADQLTSVMSDLDVAAIKIGMLADVALIDTAGRLQTKKPLMEELGKIARVLGRDLPGAPHETLLVLDSNTGQNAISQTQLFTEVTTVTGLVLTKLDGSAKGGVIVGLADEFGIPVQFVGVGEGIEDLRDFRAAEFVDALFGDD